MMLICAARQHNNVAGFRTVTQALYDRGQITSSSSVFSAGKSWQNLGVIYPAWCRDTVSGMVLVNTFTLKRSVLKYML